MSPRNLPLESSNDSSPFVRTCAQAHLSISATAFFWYESDASIVFHSSLVTESMSISERPSALSESGGGAGSEADAGRQALSAILVRDRDTREVSFACSLRASS